MTAGILVIERLDQHDRVLTRDRVMLHEGRSIVTIGRGVEADVILDDEHVAAVHVGLALAPDGRVLVSDLGSLNGIVVAGEHRSGSKDVPLGDGDVLRIGRTRLRVRSGQERLAPEKPLRQMQSWWATSYPVRLAGLAAAASIGQLVYQSWFAAPRELLETIVSALAFAALAVAAWVTVWGLLSRVMQGEWRWLRHLTICLGVAAIYGALDAVLSLTSFMVARIPSTGQATWLGLIALGLALHLHLVNASTLSVRRAAMLASVIPLLVGGVGQWLHVRNKVRDVNHISAHMSIYPAMLRLRSPETPKQFFASTAALRQAADRKMQAAITADPDGGE